MPSQKNVRLVEELQDQLSRSTIAIATGFQGVSTAALTEMRRHLRDRGVEFRVVKNTVTGLAADASGHAEVRSLLEGPTALAFGFGDPVEPIRVLEEYLRTARLPISIHGASYGRRAISSAQVATLATLPPREVLVAQLAGQLQGPMTRLVTSLNQPLAGLVYLLNAPLQGLATVLQQRVVQASSGAPG